MVPAQQVFFHPIDEKNIIGDIRFVKPAVYRGGKSESQKKYARYFLERIGVREYDEKAILEMKLIEYNSHPSKIDSSYFKDIESFVDYWKKTGDVDLENVRHTPCYTSFLQRIQAKAR